jgi:hypothetical protein
MNKRILACIWADLTLSLPVLALLGCHGTTGPADDPADDTAVQDSDTDTDTDTDTECVPNGFSATAEDFLLPTAFTSDVYPDNALQTASGTRVCASGTGGYVWSRSDLDGDGVEDLVVHFDTCGSDTTIGDSHWNVALAGGDPEALVSWALPAAFASGSYAPNALNGASGTRTFGSCGYVWSLNDVTGDGRPDLVLPYDTCGDAADVGGSTWEVFENTGAGFADAATLWTLPPVFAASPYPSVALNSLGGTRTSGACGYVWTTTDMDGDARPDLVLPYDSCGGTGVGTDSWTVYVNTGAGFAAAATPFALPAYDQAIYPATPFNNTAGTRTCSDGATSFSWALSDLNGDARPDLVVPFDTCGADTGVGTSSWRVHLNGAAGFGDALAFTLPSGFASDPYPSAALYALSGTRTCNTAEGYVWSTEDLTGDGLADLVVPYDTCGAALEPGSRFWKVYAGTGASFADSESQWSLPLAFTGGAYPSAPLNGTSGSRTCTNAGYYTWQTSDETGDGVPDLLLTVDTCAGDAGLGDTKWLKYTAGCG